jgi:GTP-binding protein EngB required for normal cell division
MILENQMAVEEIAKLLQQRLSKDILVKVYLGKDCLKVVLKAAEAPAPSIVEVLRLNELGIDVSLLTAPLKIKVYGHQYNIFEADWIKHIILNDAKSFTPISLLNETKISCTDLREARSSSAKYEEALDKCTQAAHEAFQRATWYYEKFAQQLKNFEKELQSIVIVLIRDNTSSNFSFSQVLKEIESQIHEETSINLTKLEKSLENRKHHLSEFTVVLFGRTKAGKSTLREALTKGDGSTIGKGSQRTTRDTREYHWNGLRLIDTPGIEAYQGDEDKDKAQKIAYESDMVLFLASDDSVQPDEFIQMAWLQNINKYFFIVLNVKYVERNIEDLKRLKRFIYKLKDEVFDEKRLSEHRQHIRSNVEKYVGLKEVKVVCIHANAAFLSINHEYADHADQLWQLSRVDAVYQQVISEIERSGIKRRWNSMFDEVFVHTNKLINYLENQHKLLELQVDFLHNKKGELELVFSRQTKDGKNKLERACKQEFRRIKQWIPGFVEDYLGNNNAQSEYQQRLEKEKSQIEVSMKKVLDEILNELVCAIAEFQQQYQYDSNNIKISLSDFKKYKGTDFGDLLKWAGVGLGVLSGVAFSLSYIAAANFWNPVGWVAAGASFLVGLFSWHVREQEARAWSQAKREAKESLLKSVDEAENKTCELYTKLLTEKVIGKVRIEVVEQLQSYIDAITRVEKKIKEFAAELRSLNNQMGREGRKASKSF